MSLNNKLVVKQASEVRSIGQEQVTYVAAKQIDLYKIPGVAGTHTLFTLRVLLYNFTEEDVGGIVYLDRLVGRKKTGHFHWVHPVDKDKITSSPQIMGFGYGEQMRSFGWPAQPWTVDNGYIQTEFVLTEEHIEQGYFDIVFNYNWLLFRASGSDSGVPEIGVNAHLPYYRMRLRYNNST